MFPSVKAGVMRSRAGSWHSRLLMSVIEDSAAVRSARVLPDLSPVKTQNNRSTDIHPAPFGIVGNIEIIDVSARATSAWLQPSTTLPSLLFRYHVSLHQRHCSGEFIQRLCTACFNLSIITKAAPLPCPRFDLAFASPRSPPVRRPRAPSPQNTHQYQSPWLFFAQCVPISPSRAA